MTARARLLLALAAAVFAAGLGTGGDALAQGAPAGVTPSAIGEFKDWTAYAAPVKNGKVCYALATPEKGRRRSQQPPAGAYFFISNRPQDNVLNEISVMPGFALKANSQVQIKVDGENFELFTRDGGAFVGSNEEQAKLVEAMRGARRAISITAVSTRGRSATQSYSPSGVAAALDKINQECRAPAPRAR